MAYMATGDAGASVQARRDVEVNVAVVSGASAASFLSESNFSTYCRTTHT
jgi:hypothetical protein